ncbi:MAG: chromosome segregation protein SMC [Proteobacteria bacterium]|nr:chromosome segregation protein SMC [Pseudomonadota bacterium]
MYLEHLTIHGFKSFAQKTIIDFRPSKNKGHMGITAIVGPNGSGKSNVVDAIRWVLGEQSSKQLRGKKSGDVIFAGSEKKSRNSSAQVALRLNNEDGKLDIDYSEIELSRQLFRSGDSEYLINNEKSRLQDINYLLAKANIGQKSYTVIGQGTIDSVINATPTERKDFFDEAAGIKQYQIKKEQALNKLNQSEENLNQGNIQLNEITPRLRSLTRMMKRLEQREGVLEELKTQLNIFYSLQWNELTKSLGLQLENKLETSKERDQLQKELGNLQIEMKKIANDSASTDDSNGAQDEYDKLIQEQQNLIQKRASWQGRLDSNWSQNGQQNLAFLDQQARYLEDEIKNQKQTLTSQYEKTKSSKERYKDLQKDYKELTDKIKRLQEKIFSKALPQQNQNGEIIETIKENIDGMLANIDNSLNTSIKNGESIEKIQKEIDVVVTDIRHQLSLLPVPDDSGNIISWQEQLKNLEIEKQDYDIKLRDLNGSIQALEQSTNSISEIIKQKEIELARIETEKKPLEDSTNENDGSNDIKKTLAELDEQIDEIKNKTTTLKTKLNQSSDIEKNKTQELFDLQEKSSALQKNLNSINQQITSYEVELARIQQRQDDIKHNAEYDFGKPFSEIETILENTKPDSTKSITELEKSIGSLKHKKELIGTIDDETQDEYKETFERHEWLNNQTHDLEEAILSLRSVIEDLDKKIEKQFNENISKINEKFSHYFSILFNGGKAELKIITSDITEPDEEKEGQEVDEVVVKKKKNIKPNKAITGVDIVATPPGKKLQNITMLSGGEKALTSIGLICAIIANNTSPFVVLDEVDAALDEANSVRFASILEDLSHNTQFVVVTHNRATMEKAQLLYGVTMGEDSVSKLVSIKLEEGQQFTNR